MFEQVLARVRWVLWLMLVAVALAGWLDASVEERIGTTACASHASGAEANRST